MILLLRPYHYFTYVPPEEPEEPPPTPEPEPEPVFIAGGGGGGEAASEYEYQYNKRTRRYEKVYTSTGDEQKPSAASEDSPERQRKVAAEIAAEIEATASALDAQERLQALRNLLSDLEIARRQIEEAQYLAIQRRALLEQMALQAKLDALIELQRMDEELLMMLI